MPITVGKTHNRHETAPTDRSNPLQMPKYSPIDLLSPRNRRRESQEPEKTAQMANSAGPTSFTDQLESLYRVGHRRALPKTESKKRKRPNLDRTDRLKGMSLIGNSDSGIVEERQKPKSDLIDLTTDTLPDLIDTTESHEFCFGLLRGQILAHSMPELLPETKLFATLDPVIPLVLFRDKQSVNRNIRIEVQSVAGTGPFGTLSPELSEGLAPLMDGAAGKAVRLTARVPPRPVEKSEERNKSFSCSIPVEILVYGSPANFQSVGQLLSSMQLYLQQPLNYEKTAKYKNPHLYITRQPVYRRVEDSTRTAEEMRMELTRAFENLGDMDNIPEQEPSHTIKTCLYRHQKQALYWILEHEKPFTFDEESHGRSLWKKRIRPNGTEVYYSILTNQESPQRPPSMRGSILADDMGLGKTLSTIAVLAATMPESVAFSKVEGVPKTIHSTLLVAPLSTLSNWENQLSQHFVEGCFSSYVYHGDERDGSVENLSQADIIITTYAVVAVEHRKAEVSGSLSPLHQVKFFRIVLDEAHTIRDSSTLQSQAVCALHAQRRLCLTGTPLQNRLDDLFSLVKFLRLSPLTNKHVWGSYILKPLKSGDPISVSRLQMLIKAICLRRTKTQKVNGKPLIDLPTKSENTTFLEFSTAEESNLYEQTKLASQNIVDRLVRGSASQSTYIHILQSVLRLRLICDHPVLVSNQKAAYKILMPSSISETIDGATVEQQLSSEEEAYQIWECMRDDGDVQCIGCGRNVEQEQQDNLTQTIGYLSACSHLLCGDCAQTFKKTLEQSVRQRVSPCPLCGQSISTRLFQLKAAGFKKARRRKLELDSTFRPSTKLKALLQDLTSDFEADSTVKAVIFSQWTQMLDLIEMEIRRAKFCYSRLDGTMNRATRLQAIDSFQDGNAVIILVSLKAGGLGCYIMDPAFNPASEAQAVDRVHRLGQRRPIRVTRYMIKNSIEENILQLQKKKMQMADFVNQTVPRLSMEERIKELRELFA